MVGGNFSKRQEDKCALEQMRVRQRQIGFVQHNVVIGENIDVDRARSPAPFLPPIAAQRPFDALYAYKQCVRIEQGRYDDRRIDKRRLVRNAPRRRAIIRRARDKAHGAIGAQHCNGALERGADVAEIAAQREQSFGQRLIHDLRLRARSIVTPTSSNVAAIGACGLCTVTRTLRTCGQRANTASPRPLPPSGSYAKSCSKINDVIFRVQRVPNILAARKPRPRQCRRGPDDNNTLARLLGRFVGVGLGVVDLQIAGFAVIPHAPGWRSHSENHLLFETRQPLILFEDQGDVAGAELIKCFVLEWIGSGFVPIVPRSEVFFQAPVGFASFGPWITSYWTRRHSIMRLLWMVLV